MHRVTQVQPQWDYRQPLHRLCHRTVTMRKQAAGGCRRPAHCSVGLAAAVSGERHVGGRRPYFSVGTTLREPALRGPARGCGSRYGPGVRRWPSRTPGGRGGRAAARGGSRTAAARRPHASPCRPRIPRPHRPAGSAGRDKLRVSKASLFTTRRAGRAAARAHAPPFAQNVCVTSTKPPRWICSSKKYSWCCGSVRFWPTISSSVLSQMRQANRRSRRHQSLMFAQACV